MTKSKLKNEVLESLIIIQTKIIEFQFEDNQNMILLFENLKNIKLDFLKFFEEFDKDIYNEEHFIINIRRIIRFFKKKLLTKINDFLIKLSKKKIKKSEFKMKKIHIKFLIFVK